MTASPVTASKAQVAALLTASRDNLLAYCCAVDPRYIPYAWHKYLCRRLEAAIRRGCGRIMVFAPPQHGKSALISCKLPAWVMGRHPDWPIIAASYGVDLAERNGKAVRDLIGSPLHRAIFPASQLDGSSTAKTDFMTTAGGQYYGTTVMGGGTGFSSKLFVVDDPFKSRAEADSEVVRERVKDWYRSVVYSRLAEDAVLVIMHTRWHEDDLAGWLMREHAHENWEVINLPALALEGDALGREVGQALCPERYSEAALELKRIASGSRDWEALYMQRPVAGTGGFFKRVWLREYDSIPITIARPMNRYLLVDPAGSKAKRSDFTAVVVIGLNTDGRYYLLDAVRDKLNLRERAALVIRMHRKWKPHKVGYEKYGKDADIEHLTVAMEAENYRFTVHELGGQMAKEARIKRLEPDFENGRWWLPRTLPKALHDGKPVDVIERFVNEEYLTFPAGVHDDMLDSMARIYDIQAAFPKGVGSVRRASASDSSFAW
jgi:predicted phage terminase large subunit-like protein